MNCWDVCSILGAYTSVLRTRALSEMSYTLSHMIRILCVFYARCRLLVAPKAPPLLASNWNLRITSSCSAIGDLQLSLQSARLQVMISNDGYINLQLEVRQPADTAHVPLEVVFPEGRLIGTRSGNNLWVVQLVLGANCCVCAKNSIFLSCMRRIV